MRTRIMLSVGVLLIMGWAAMCLAAPPSMQNVGTSSGLSYNVGLRDITIWCQPPDLDNWAKLATQIDQVYPFDAGIAEDFVAGDEAITHIQWWGGQWNYAGYGISPPPCGPEYFVITFYTWDGTCFPADPMPVAPTYHPNNYYYQELVYAWSEIVIDGPLSLSEYSADIGPVLTNAGETYWVEIQAVMSFANCGQWGWLNTINPTYGCYMARGFPLLGNAYWYSDVDYTGTAFCLYSDESVDNEAETWGGVKSMYR